MTVLVRRLTGPVGRRLMGSLEGVAMMAGGAGMSAGETYVLGHSPLVLLAALTSSFQPWPASSESRLPPAPVVADDGSYTGATMPTRTLRVWTRLDSAAMLRDFYAKVAER